MQTINSRSSEYDIDPLFMERWSPRAFTGKPITQAQLFTLFDAARWAPSSYNAQPWRFVYGLRDTPEWDHLFPILDDFNQIWAKNAAAVVIICSRSVIDRQGKDGTIASHTHSFDTGAAWVQFALQATRMGLAAHGMIGIDLKAAETRLNLPADHRVEAAAVVGWPGDKALLPDNYRMREQPSSREPVSHFAVHGAFPKD